MALKIKYLLIPIALGIGILPIIDLKFALIFLCIVVGFYGVIVWKKIVQSRVNLKYSSLTDYTPIEKEVIAAYSVSRFIYYTGMFFIGQQAFRLPFSFTLSDYLFLASFTFMAFIFLNARDKLPNYPKGIIIGLFLFLVGAFISSYTASSPLASVATFIRVPYIILVWFGLGTIILKNEKHVRTAVWMWVLSIAVNGLVAILSTKFSIPYTSSTWGRQAAFADHVNDLGGSSAIAWVPALYLATQYKWKGIKKVLSFLPLILVGMGAVLSGTVSGFIVIFAGTLVWLFVVGLNKRLLLITAIGAIGLALLIGYQVQNGLPTPFERLELTTSSSNQDSSFQSRVQTYQEAWQYIQNQPFIGVGFDAASKTTESGFEPHNILVGVFFKGGIIALIGIIIIIVSFFLIGVSLLRSSADKKSYLLNLSLFVSYLSSVLFSMTSPALYQRYIWVPTALLVALYLQQKLKQRSS
ncbi:hypothetical protein BG53_11520 [Paenibacillus darwinianus]|uniref:O-antigen ligase-related domain-containing protein n=1 Tax=Paenibacillus darwinianus TaxID=1380763 RepID=A0A9W5W828_9BACL|nr:O-antigen ligase family protein [Paenibacillus darwinianus]EXX91455.1 hypothetical protein BG53_11520 [Paenibacillus darwinianus]